MEFQEFVYRRYGIPMKRVGAYYLRFWEDPRRASEIYMENYRENGIRYSEAILKASAEWFGKTKGKENKKEEMQSTLDELVLEYGDLINLDRIRGCLVGLAAGDALGYPPETMGGEEFHARYGRDGIREYALDPETGKALISSNTQMALFAAGGLLLGDTRGVLRGAQGEPAGYVREACRDWYLTQTKTMEEVNRHERCTPEGGRSWLLDVPELYAGRNPGRTCLEALAHGTGSMEHPVNGSRGCGALARVVPLALDCPKIDRGTDRQGAQIAALTHGHSLGYMPAAILTHILCCILSVGRLAPLRMIFENSIKTLDYSEDGNELRRILTQAVKLAENHESDPENLSRLGSGWTADQALAIALYCALRHEDDFSGGIAAAVNGSGARSTCGAVTGAILGALLGYEKIEEQWGRDLELRDVVLEMADDLCRGCTLDEEGHIRDRKWIRKYCEFHRASGEAEGRSREA